MKYINHVAKTILHKNRIISVICNKSSLEQIAACVVLYCSFKLHLKSLHIFGGSFVAEFRRVATFGIPTNNHGTLWYVTAINNSNPAFSQLT